MYHLCTANLDFGSFVNAFYIVLRCSLWQASCIVFWKVSEMWLLCTVST